MFKNWKQYLPTIMYRKTLDKKIEEIEKKFLNKRVKDIKYCIELTRNAKYYKSYETIKEKLDTNLKFMQEYMEFLEQTYGTNDTSTDKTNTSINGTK